MKVVYDKINITLIHMSLPMHQNPYSVQYQFSQNEKCTMIVQNGQSIQIKQDLEV